MQTTNVTYASIKALQPCYDPIKFIPEDWSGSITDILKMSTVPAKDRVWVTVREQFMSIDQLRKFALFCARQCEKHTTDPRVKACNDTTQAYLQGEATLGQLQEARRKATHAATAYATATAYAAATAYDAATAAAYAAATAAVDANATAAVDAYAAVREEQCLYLVEVLGAK